MDDLIERLRNYGDLTDSELHSSRIDAADEIERLTAEVERRKYDTMHTCHAECQREACALRREVDALRAERDAVHAGVSGKCRHTSDRNRAATALKGSTDANLVRGTIADSDGDDGA